MNATKRQEPCCEVCGPRGLGVYATDIGVICPRCQEWCVRLERFLIQVLGWRPMTREERRRHV